jgi:hypothetical protein
MEKEKGRISIWNALQHLRFPSSPIIYCTCPNGFLVNHEVAGPPPWTETDAKGRFELHPSRRDAGRNDALTVAVVAWMLDVGGKAGGGEGRKPLGRMPSPEAAGQTLTLSDRRAEGGWGGASRPSRPERVQSAADDIPLTDEMLPPRPS